MLHYIKGKFMMRIDGGVVIETGGIGFEINVPDNSAVYLSSEGDTVSLFLNMIVREDDMSLYGFSEKEGLDLFKKLITVNGVGAKAAMAILSIAPVSEIRKAIAFEDADFLTRASGVGKKTAQRIVLELKDKIGDVSGVPGISPVSEALSVGGDARGEALSALMALGYSRAEAAGAIAAVPENDLTSEDYIKRALKKLF